MAQQLGVSFVTTNLTTACTGPSWAGSSGPSARVKRYISQVGTYARSSLAVESAVELVHVSKGAHDAEEGRAVRVGTHLRNGLRRACDLLPDPRHRNEEELLGREVEAGQLCRVVLLQSERRRLPRRVRQRQPRVANVCKSVWSSIIPLGFAHSRPMSAELGQLHAMMHGDASDLRCR